MDDRDSRTRQPVFILHEDAATQIIERYGSLPEGYVVSKGFPPFRGYDEFMENVRALTPLQDHEQPPALHRGGKPYDKARKRAQKLARRKNRR